MMEISCGSERIQGKPAGEQLLFPFGPPRYVQHDETLDDPNASQDEEAKVFGRGLKCTRRILHCCFSTFSRMAMLGDGATTTSTRMGSNLDALMIVPKSGYEDNRIIMYLHGGGHIMGTPWVNRSIAVNLAKTCRARVFSLSYRLAPENPFPAALEDTCKTWRWLRQQYPDASIAIGGASAGGNLCFALLIVLAQRKEQQPIACIGLSPWLKLDQTEFRRDGIKKLAARQLVSYCQGHPVSDPLVSPLLASDDAIKSFPPVIMHASEQEFLAGSMIAMGKRCSDNGVTVEAELFPGSTHVFQQTQRLQQTKDSFAKIGIFLSHLW